MASSALCKCAVLLFFFAGKAFNRALNITQRHFRDVAGRSPQDRDRFRGIEVKNMLKILDREIRPRVIAAACQEHKAHAALERRSQPDLSVQLIQFLQKAAFLHPLQVLVVVSQIVHHRKGGHIHQSLCKAVFVFDLAKAVFKALQYRSLIPLLQRPALRGCWCQTGRTHGAAYTACPDPPKGRCPWFPC